VRNEPHIIFEDESLMVIDKPSGIVVNKAQTVKDETVQEWFWHRMKGSLDYARDDNEWERKGGIVHRLDKDTSGVMVLAKTPEAYEKLKLQFLERKTVKKYVALVHGEFKEAKGLINTPIERIGQKFYVGKDLSRMAITEWEVVKKIGENTLVELTPHTGRTHQLRVHMRYLGHPIVSDPLYGDRKTWKRDLEFCPRLFLHAKYLEFTHPVTGEKVHFEAKLPTELENLIH